MIDHVLLGKIAGVLALIQIIPYVISIFRGNTKPQRATFAIWSVVNIVTATSYIAAGATTTKWMSIVFVFTAILIFLLSFKYGMGGYGALDISCMAIAGLAIALWVVTDNPVVALYANLAALSLGYIPTLKKVYRLPRTENMLAWLLTGAASILNVMALTSLAPEIALLPLIGMVGSVSVALLIVSAKLQWRKVPKRRVMRA